MLVSGWGAPGTGAPGTPCITGSGSSAPPELLRLLSRERCGQALWEPPLAMVSVDSEPLQDRKSHSGPFLALRVKSENEWGKREMPE